MAGYSIKGSCPVTHTEQKRLLVSICTFLLFLSITWETDSISAVEPCYESIVPCPHLHPWALEKCWYKHSESSHNRRGEVIPEMKNQASHMVSHLSLCISRNFTGKRVHVLGDISLPLPEKPPWGGCWRLS